jgi:hypothetical protein
MSPKAAQRAVGQHMSFLWLLPILLSLIATSSASPLATQANLEAKLTAQRDVSWIQMRRYAAELWRTDLDARSALLHHGSAANARLLFDDLSTLAFYTHEARYVEAQQKAYERLQQFQANETNDRVALYKNMLAARLWSDARTLRQSGFDLRMRAWPDIVDLRTDALNKSRTVLQLKGSQFERVDASNLAAKILVVSSPYCHFSNDALAFIASDAKLLAVFQASSYWLQPVDANFDLTERQNLQKTYPWLNMGIAYRQREWPEIRSWATPNFLFIVKGKVIVQVQGWPEGGQAEAIRAAVGQWDKARLKAH